MQVELYRCVPNLVPGDDLLRADLYRVQSAIEIGFPEIQEASQDRKFWGKIVVLPDE